jgi:hypothetical protein
MGLPWEYRGMGVKFLKSRGSSWDQVMGLKKFLSRGICQGLIILKEYKIRDNLLSKEGDKVRKKTYRV